MNRAEHRALIPPKQIKAEQELLQKLTHPFLISYRNKSLLPLRTDFLPLLSLLTGHLPPEQTSTTCLGGTMVSIYPGHAHHLPTAFKQVHQVKALCAAQAGLRAQLWDGEWGWQGLVPSAEGQFAGVPALLLLPLLL